MCDLDSLDQVRLYIPSLLQILSSIYVSPSSSSASPSSYASLQRPMDMNSSNPDGIGGDDNDVVNVILWSGGRISNRVGSFCFVDISNSSTVADLVNKELHQLTNNFSFFTEEVISEDDLSASNYHAGTITSRCSFRGSNTPLPLGTRCNVTPVIADRVICKGGGPSSGGHVVMSKGGGGFCHKQARLSIQSPAETCDAPAKSAEFPQEGNAPLTPCEQTDNMVPQSGGCIQSIEKTDRSITTLVSEVTSSASDFASVDGLGQLPDWCRKTSVIR
ncbi:hypothetical protein C5167_029343 [Papaver somniferum]|nr:hypothetical protein C5167_029343 [Papaver somniferum]